MSRRGLAEDDRLLSNQIAAGIGKARCLVVLGMAEPEPSGEQNGLLVKQNRKKRKQNELGQTTILWL